MEIFTFLNSAFYDNHERAEKTLQILSQNLPEVNWHKVSDLLPDQLPQDSILICFVDQSNKIDAFTKLIKKEFKSKTIIFDLNSDNLLECAENNQFLAVIGFDSVTKWHLNFPNNYFKLGIDYGFYGRKEFFNSKTLNTIDISNFSSLQYCILYSEKKSDISEALLNYLKNRQLVQT
jgi:hypothetical protein